MNRALIDDDPSPVSGIVARRRESIGTRNELAFEGAAGRYTSEPACNVEGAKRRERRERERRGRERSVHARRWPRIGALYENEKVTKAEVKSVHT